MEGGAHGDGPNRQGAQARSNGMVAQALTLIALTNAPEHIDHRALSADASYTGLSARLLVNGVGAPENPVFLPLISR